MKKLLTSLLCVMMVVCFMPAMAWATDGGTVISVATAGELVEAIQTGGNIKLAADITVTESITLNSVNQVSIDLNDNTLFLEIVDRKTAINVKNGAELTLENGNIVAEGYGAATAVIGVESGSSITLNNVNYTTDGAALFPKGDAAKVTVNSSEITAGAYAVATNAATDSNYNVVIELQDSVFNGTSPILINVPGTLKMDGCTVNGIMHGVIVRGGTAEIRNSAIKQEYTGDNAETMAKYFDNADWGSGNMVNLGAVIIGNKNPEAYQYPTSVTLENTNVQTVGENAKLFPALYSYANSAPNKGVTLNYSDCTFNGDVICGNESKNIVVSEAKIGDIYYSTLSEAINSANQNDTIKLLTDVTVSSEIKLSTPGIILEGNGKTITVNHAVTGDSGSAGILVSADNITIQNAKIVGPNSSGSWQTGQYVIKIYNAKNTAIKDVELTNGSGAVQVNGSTATISGSMKFHDNVYNGIEVSNQGTLTMDSSAAFEVPDNTASVIWKDEAGAGTIITNGTVAQTINDEKPDEHRYVNQAPAIQSGTDYYLTIADAVKYVADNAKITLLKDTEVSQELVDKKVAYEAPAGVKITNDSDQDIQVKTPNGTITIKAKQSAVSQPYTPPYVPTAPTTQKPVIEPNADVTTTLSTDGTTLTIKANDGYEITDVTVNGVSKGAVTTLTGLKTGDKIIIKTQKIETPDDNAALIEAVKNTKLVARSAMSTAKGKKAVKVSWYAADGSDLDFDGYEVFRSLKRYSGFGTTPIFKTANEKYYNTAIKKGNKYYYKVRAYKVIDGEKVYTDWSTKAWRTVK